MYANTDFGHTSGFNDWETGKAIKYQTPPQLSPKSANGVTRRRSHAIAIKAATFILLRVFTPFGPAEQTH
jgi:hypothetical protein